MRDGIGMGLSMVSIEERRGIQKLDIRKIKHKLFQDIFSFSLIFWLLVKSQDVFLLLK